MNRQEKISEKDARLLSGYLDGVLSSAEASKFEKRLQTSPQLTLALKEMSATKQYLRGLPSHKVPYQFGLTRAEAKKARRGRFLLPSFGWASAVCSLLLAVIFGTEFILHNFSAPQAMPAMMVTSEQAEAPTESLAKERAVEDEQPVYLLNWVTLGGKGGAGGAEISNYALADGGFGGGFGGGSIEPIEPDIAEEPAQSVEAPQESTGEKLSVEPLIFGVRKEALGQVLAVKPTEAEQAAQVDQQQTEELTYSPKLGAEVKLILAGLAVSFALVWLILKLRR